MSQHHFTVIHNGEETEILMGWDKLLQGFFLVIEKLSDEDEPFWSILLTILDSLKIGLFNFLIDEKS